LKIKFELHLGSDCLNQNLQNVWTGIFLMMGLPWLKNHGHRINPANPSSDN